MKVTRKVEIETNEFRVGDQLNVGHYTATCQDVTPEGAVFLMDQYLDEPMPMNEDDANEGGYMASDLRKRLNSDEILTDFKELRDRMAPFNNGDLLRLPFYGELLGHDFPYEFGAVEPDDCEQWELMKDMRSQIAFRRNGCEWGWLQNMRARSAGCCAVGARGAAGFWSASSPLGVRPVFLIRCDQGDKA